MNTVYDKINNIQTKDDFLEFLKLLIIDFKSQKKEWENKEVDTYLEGIHNWTEDMEEYFEHKKLAVPSNLPWYIFANILIAAKTYE